MDQKNKDHLMKILVIRFSSIGDIVLTGPILRCLFEQMNAQIHFLTKSIFEDIHTFNPYINKQHVFESSSSFDMLIEKLQSESYDLVIDLHSSIRSKRICRRLRIPFVSVAHPIWKRFILLKWNNHIILDHVVDRYFNALKSLNIENDQKGLDFFLDSSTGLSLPQKPYIAWSIGASYDKKQLSSQQIAAVINQVDKTFVLIGGSSDSKLALQIMNLVKNDNCVDLCGKTPIQDSAYLLKHSQIAMSNDSGMMHIASAFDKKMISFWGCTKPSLGFSPYRVTNNIMLLSPYEGPCSKHGKTCNHTSNGCIKEIKPIEIIKAINSLI